MGQTIGKAPLAVPEVAHFANSFNDVAEGFGLTQIEFREILQCSLRDYLGFSEKRLAELAQVVFDTFDDDRNHLIDALECLASLAILSGMSKDEKIRYVFGIYDFDESGVLSIDETILALRSTISGLSKLSGVDPPLEPEVESLALMAFKNSVDQEEEANIDVDSFTKYCRNTPEIVSWLEYCEEIPEEDLQTPTFRDSAVLPILEREAKPCQRNNFHLAAMDLDAGLPLVLAQEDRGFALDLCPQDPWRGTVAFTEPSVVPRNIPTSAPNSNLELEWTYSFNSTASRGSIHYTVKGNVVFGSGSTGVLLNQNDSTQRFFVAHSDLVSCVSVYHTQDGGHILRGVGGETGKRGRAASTLVCSGEIGARPRLCIWCAETCEVLSIFRGFHRVGITHACFSRDGELVVSVGADHGHSVAVFHWRSRTTLFTAPSGSEVVLGCHMTDHVFVTCGVDHLRLWTSHGGAYQMDKGIFGRKGALQPMLCCTSLGDRENLTVLSGSTSGHLYVWEGRNCIRCIKAHTGALTAIARDANQGEEGFVTGSADGKIQLWNSKLEMGMCIDIRALGPLSNIVHSLCWDSINHKLLVGTESCEVFELLDADGSNIRRGALLQGHFGNGVRGLAAHPEDANLFASAGADCTVRVWNSAERKLVKMCVLDTPARCICYNPDGTILAVGLGGGLMSDDGDWETYSKETSKSNGNGSISTKAGNRKDGAWVILREKDLTVAHEARDSKMPINAIRWSPDGGTLAVASEDTFVYLYNSGDYVAKAKCVGLKGEVSHLDFSSDGQYIQCDSRTGGELLFFDTERGDQMTPATMRDMEWDTQTCVFGWPVQGAWGTFVDGCVLTSASRANNGEQMVTADTYGRVRLYQYPVTHLDQDFREFRGHAAPVQNSHFLADDRHLITCGGRDCALMQWRFQPRANAEGEGLISNGKTSLSDIDIEVDTVKMEVEERLHYTDLKDQLSWDQALTVDRTKNGDPAALLQMEEMAGDDDFAPLKPWHRAVAAPSDAPEEDTREPENDLVLEWVHGYRCHDCRGSGIYTDKGEVLFFAGSVAVRQQYGSISLGVVFPGLYMYDVPKKVQRFFKDHTDEILAIAYHPVHPFAASSQRGRIPKVIVWDVEEMRMARVLEGYHRRAVTLVSFSPNGRLLATLGADDHHGLAVYDWENSTIVCRTRTGPEKTLSLGFTLDSNGLILCADGTIDFWSIQGGHNMVRRPASLGPKGKRQLFMCQGWDGTNPVVGTYDGSIYRFLGCRLEAVVKAHTAEVFAMSSTGDGIATGGADGFVKIWMHNLQLKHEISMAQSSPRPAIRSLCWDTQRDKILVGTAGNEIFEFNATSGENLHGEGVALLQGHAGRELWGLAHSPAAPEFCTVGEDRHIRVWDIYSKRCLRSQELEMPSRAVTYSPDGSLIAVGFGLPVRESSKQFDGKWIVVQEDDFQTLHEARDSQKHITDIKWASTGQSLAMGAADSKIYVYSTSDRYSLTAMLTTHNSPITALDFSTDGRYVRSTCQAYELFYHESDTGMVIPAASRLKNIEWDTQTSLFGWASQGAWPPEADGTESSAHVQCCKLPASIGENFPTDSPTSAPPPLPQHDNLLHVTKVLSMDATLKNEHLNKALAVGDNMGRVRLLRQPCTSAYASAKTYRGHAAGISRLRWTMGESHLISIGQEDRCVFQWRHERDDLAAKEVNSRNVSDEGPAGSLESGPQDTVKKGPVKTSSGGWYDSDEDPEADSLAMVVDFNGRKILHDENDENEERLWIKNLIEPSYVADLGNDPSAPGHGLTLARLWGIRSQGLTRGALGYNRQGGLVYPSATLGVVYDRRRHSQNYFHGHKDKHITALSVSANGRFVVSGETGRHPRVRVWDATTCVELCLLPAHHRQGIASLGFSRDGLRLVSVGTDMDKSIAVWRSSSGEWHDGELQAAAKGGRGSRHVFFAEFSFLETDQFQVISGGADHIKFWILEGRLLTARLGLFGKVGKCQTMLCGSSVASARFVSGAVSGHLYVWKGRWLEKTVRAHQRCINAVNHSPGGFVTAGKDGFVKLWSSQLEHLKSYDLSEAHVPPLLRGVRMVCAQLDLTGTEVIKIAVATAGSEVYEISRESGGAILMQEGHFSGQLWGLATHPTDPDVCATAGDDKSIRIWSISLGMMVRKAFVDGSCRALGWSPDGQFLLVGMGGSVSGERARKDGAFLVLDTLNMEVVFEGRDSRSCIRACCFSPDGKTFALGSVDNKIYIYDARSFALRAKAQKHNGAILAIDFSEDSHYIQSNSADNEHLYYNASDGTPFAVQAQLKHVKWADWTCPFGWPVQGVWPPADKGMAPITSLHRSHDKSLAVIADEAGNIKLYRYPVLSKQAEFHVVSGHAGGISCIRFTANDKHVISLGKGDRSIFVWNVTIKGDDGATLVAEIQQ